MEINNTNIPRNHPNQIYSSLLIPFSENPTLTELAYRAANLQKTKGTLFIIPPPNSVLRATYNAPPRPKTRMSSGAVALCKHFERIPDSPQSKRDQASSQRHPFWSEPRGSNDDKTRIAERILETMLESACWRNVMLLHRDVAVYEIRNRRGWGMRWTLLIEEVTRDDDFHAVSVDHSKEANPDERTSTVSLQIDDQCSTVVDANTHRQSGTHENSGNGNGIVEEIITMEHSDDPNLKEWKIKDVNFRGFLEPIEGMGHELLD